MTKEQFIEKMKEFGYTEDEIEEHIDIHERAKAEGINMPYEIGLVKKPIAF